jgi:hypothetical protein
MDAEYEYVFRDDLILEALCNNNRPPESIRYPLDEPPRLQFQA